jgi:hypothetical protein
MRIRTDGDYEYRQDVIDEATEFYGRNKTESLLRSARDVPKLVEGIQDVLERDDLTHKQRVELAETLSTRHFGFEFNLEGEEIVVTVDAD